MITKKVTELYKAKRELTILQGAFLGLTAISLMLSGLLALINQSVGVAALVVPAAGATVFVINTVAWALIKLVLDRKIERDIEIKKAIERELKKK